DVIRYVASSSFGFAGMTSQRCDEPRAYMRAAFLLVVAVSAVCCAACGRTSTLPAHPAAASAWLQGAPKPAATQSKPPPSPYLADTWNGIFLYQKFDYYHQGLHSIPPDQA